MPFPSADGDPYPHKVESEGGFAVRATARLRTHHAPLFADLAPLAHETAPDPASQSAVMKIAREHGDMIRDLALATIERNMSEVEQATDFLAGWMDHRSTVRVIASRRTGLALGAPSYRLVRGGARVHVPYQPMPVLHPLHGGGVITAATGAGATRLVPALARVRTVNGDIGILGLGDAEAQDMRMYCDVFIELAQSAGQRTERSDHGRHLMNDYVCQAVLDALITAAAASLGRIGSLWHLDDEDMTTDGEESP